jgi:hypothetical protein
MSQNPVFESSASEPRALLESRHIIDALAVDPQVAGDSYVRWAKTRWRGLMDILNPERIKELAGGGHPLWTLQHSVCLSIHDKSTREESGKLLEDLVQDLAEEVLKIHGRYRFGERPKMVLVGALSAKASHLGGGFFNFTLKQKLTVGK